METFIFHVDVTVRQLTFHKNSASVSKACVVSIDTGSKMGYLLFLKCKDLICWSQHVGQRYLLKQLV